MARRHDRVYYLGRQLLDRRLRMLGYDAHRAAGDLPLGPHEHQDAYEICLTLRGSIEWWVGDEVHETGPGQAYVTRPGEQHGAVDAVIQPSAFYWVQVVPRRADAAAAWLAGLRLRVFEVSDAALQAVATLLEEHGRRDALSPTAARASLDALLVALARDHDAAMAGDAGRERSPAIAGAMAWAIEHLHEDFGTGDWAREARLSTTHFHDRFRRETGFSPADWRTRQRIRVAKGLLGDPSLSVTDVAMRCGFSTSQYFATAFRRLTGASPRDYRAAAATPPRATRSAPARPAPRPAAGGRGATRG